MSGDSAARVIEQRLDKIDPTNPSAMLAFERELLDIACDQLEFISVIEKSHLERLKEDRNICAHPTFSSDGGQFTPLAETTLSYIVQSANYLLIHPPVKGKVVVDRLYRLINEESFPEDDEKAFVVLSSDNNLGRVRQSTIRNLIIVLLKRMFLDEDGISSSLLNRISSSLGAISRLYPEVYKEVIESKLSQMLSEGSDKQLKRVLPFLNRRKETWRKIEQAVKIRIEGLLPTMSVDNLIAYQVVPLAEHIPQILDAIERRMIDLNDSDKSKLLTAAPSPLLKKHAIELFIKSMSFDSAEHRGQYIILPLSKHLSGDEIKEILVGSCENKGAYGYNQILPAGGIDSFFVKFYKMTKATNPIHKDSWLEFRNKIKESNHSYDSLDEVMIEDGLIEPKQEEQEHDDEIPF